MQAKYTHIITVQPMSKSTFACGEHVCVLQFLSSLESKHVCDMKWAARESTFVYYMQAIFVRCTIIRNMRVMLYVLHASQSS